MMMKKGLIQIVVIFVILILLASAFKVNLRGGYIDSTPEQALKSNMVMVIQTGKVMWNDYILPPIKTVWSGYVLPFIKAQWLGGLKTKLQEQTTLPPG